MMRYAGIGGFAALVVLAGSLSAAPAPDRRTPRQALQGCNDLIGSWRAFGTPEGTREEKQKGSWAETIRWEWQFKGDDAWLRATFDKGRYFTRAELRYLPDKDRFRLTAATPAGDSLTFEGSIRENVLRVERTDDKTKETQRLVFTLLHEDRHLYDYEVKPAERTDFRRVYRVGATRDGVDFAHGDGQPECVVSGGRGTMAVTYKGQTYYVCCSGCREAFKDDPEKYIKEFEARKAAKKKP